jgi:hypothetical protein
MTALLGSCFSLALIYAFPLWLMGSGFLSVYVYQRRTGESLTVRSGARIGWITGLFSFSIIGLLFTLVMVSQIQSGEYLKRASENPFFRLTPAQMQLFSTPLFLSISVLFYLAVLFVIFTLLPIAGGALGAKMLGKN